MPRKRRSTAGVADQIKSPQHLSVWPPPIAQMLKRVRSLDAEVQRTQLCAPALAAAARQERRAILCLVENAKMGIMAAEADGLRSSSFSGPHERKTAKD